MHFGEMEEADPIDKLATVRHLAILETRIETLGGRFDTMVKLYTDAMNRVNDIDRRVSEKVGAFTMLDRLSMIGGGVVGGVVTLYFAEHVLHLALP
jgi:hypothetical protein